MPDPAIKPSTMPAASTTADRGHPMPRRASPEASITLHHHRLARDASILKARQEASARPTASHTSIAGEASPGESPRRESSGESHITGKSDPRNWFDRSNKNPEHASNRMEIDTPFFQKESDSSNEEARPGPSAPPPTWGLNVAGLPLAPTQSSSEDFRSIVDDLTVENKRLKEELKRYKQFGPGLMRKDKLFEIKVHGLPARKKRELEATLRDFAASLGGSSHTASPKRKSKHSPRLHHSNASMSKHASSSSSNSRPVDSAYASMSTGQGSSGTSLHRPNLGSRSRSSDQKVESYLDDIPAGLYPGLNPMALNESDKARLIVKKLEQLFTGRITGRSLGGSGGNGGNQSEELLPTVALAPLAEPSREAVIQQQLGGKKTRSRDNMSSNGESGGNDTGSGSGENSGRTTAFKTPPDAAPLPEQRPTRPRDLDPDRPQVPSENMDYIRHLGLVPPELLAGTKAKQQDVSPDAEGWVYLNLLANLAQLHILNVSPDFIRRAVREKSSKFQVSPDGRKIRWRGGTEGTKFSSDSSGEVSNEGPSSDMDDDMEDGSDENGERKRRRTEHSGSSGKKRSTMAAQAQTSAASFHYKPLFVHRQTSGDTSIEDSESQDSQLVDDSAWGNGSRQPSGSGSTPRRRRRADGAMVFYTGAPFCIDLSGDHGDTSPTTYLTSTGQQESLETAQTRPTKWRSMSGSSLLSRPLTDRPKLSSSSSGDKMDVESNSPPHDGSSDPTDESEIEDEFEWCKDPQKVSPRPIKPPLEPSGIGGVCPDDHFAVVVTTRRPRAQAPSRGDLKRKATDDSTESIMQRLAKMSTSSPRAQSAKLTPHVLEIQYVSGKVHRFEPLPLPAPLQFVPPFTESSDTTDYGESGGSQLDEMEDDQEVLVSSSEDVLSLKANPHNSDIPTDLEEASSVESDFNKPGPAKLKGKGRMPRLGRSMETQGVARANVDSSVATAGGAESGYSSK